MRFPAAILLFLAGLVHAMGKLTPLAPVPDWSRLEVFQETITQQEFLAKLDETYAPGAAWKPYFEVGPESVAVATGSGRPPFVLRFAASPEQRKPVTRWWRARSELPAPPDGKPLTGVRIALDPGHLGGSWAKMEERWFRVGGSKPVVEGDMTLLVARLLAARLGEMGAEVFLTRSKPGPITSLRPDALTKAARASLEEKGQAAGADALENEAERLFYRVGEIRRRAELINAKFRPDLVICLHFNAEAWGDETRPRLVEDNHLHFLVTGAWSADELAYEDQRFDMLFKLLSQTLPEEVAVSASVATTMASATGLPPYTYKQANAAPVGGNPYLWARNLLANRLFRCPVVYVEPYVMNSRAAFARIQAGDYEGRRTFAGTPRKSIYREYADAVAEGLAAYYGRR